MLSLARTYNYLHTLCTHLLFSRTCRQFLFRKDNVGKAKSVGATEAVKKMNKDINVDCKVIHPLRGHLYAFSCIVDIFKHYHAPLHILMHIYTLYVPFKITFSLFWSSLYWKIFSYSFPTFISLTFLILIAFNTSILIPFHWHIHVTPSSPFRSCWPCLLQKIPSMISFGNLLIL